MIRLDQLQQQNQGIVFIVAGSLLLLYALDIMRQGLKIIVIVGAVYMIWYGLELLGVVAKLKNKK